MNIPLVINKSKLTYSNKNCQITNCSQACDNRWWLPILWIIFLISFLVNFYKIYHCFFLHYVFQLRFPSCIWPKSMNDFTFHKLLLRDLYGSSFRCITFQTFFSKNCILRIFISLHKFMFLEILQTFFVIWKPLFLRIRWITSILKMSRGSNSSWDEERRSQKIEDLWN